jgi:hypothetical protein
MPHLPRTNYRSLALASIRGVADFLVVILTDQVFVA